MIVRLWRKWLPESFLLGSYMMIWLLLLSALGMWYSVFIGKGDLTHSQIQPVFKSFSVLMPFYVAPMSTPFLLIFGSGLFCWASWLWSTRVRVSSTSLRARTFYFFFAWGTFTLLFMVFTIGYMKPISYDKLMLVDGWVTKADYRPYLHPGGLKLLGWALIFTPSIVILQFWSKLLHEYRSDKVIQEWFSSYKFQLKYLGTYGDDKVISLPDITLARDAEIKTPVVLSGEARQLGTMLIGPPGSGKTSLKIIKAFRQDLEHIQRAMNAYPDYIKKLGRDSAAFHRSWGKHLIGSIVIEPAKDLCDKAYELALEHGIPESFVIYLDPSNPDTPGFNSMVGPLEQVAETITAVLEGMSESTDDFFRQSCRTVLKQYIYLIKFLYKNNCSLIELERMYQDTRYVADMVEMLEKKIPEAGPIAKMPKDKMIYWSLASRTIAWFRSDGIAVEKDRQTGVVQKYHEGPHIGKVKFIDKQNEFTRTTRNLLSDLISNPYLARILMGQNDVDLDKLMSRGGILLCNTATGELGNVSEAFGKLVLMSVQNAVFRRKGEEKTRPLISLYVDEFYDYMNLPFLKLAGQGRKYKLAPLIACQTLAQFDIKFGRGFTDGMLGTIRNYVVYGGVGIYDAEKLSPMFGMQVVDAMTIRENITPESMSNPSYSYSESTEREEVEMVSADQMMFNKFKYSYIRLIVEGSTQKAIRAEGDFVDLGKAEKWKRALDKKSLELFMAHWNEVKKEDENFDMDWIDEDFTLTEIMPDVGTNQAEKVATAEVVSVKPTDYIGRETIYKEIEKTSQQRPRFNTNEGVSSPASVKVVEIPHADRSEPDKTTVIKNESAPVPVVSLPNEQTSVPVMSARAMLSFDGDDQPTKLLVEQPLEIEVKATAPDLHPIINSVYAEAAAQQKAVDERRKREQKSGGAMNQLPAAKEVDMNHPLMRKLFDKKGK